MCLKIYQRKHQDTQHHATNGGAIHFNVFLTSHHHIKNDTFQCQFILLRKSVMVLMDLGVPSNFPARESIYQSHMKTKTHF